MATIGFKRVILQGFVVQLSSRTLSSPAVGYLAANGTVVQDYTQAQKFTTQVLAQDALTTLKATLSGDVLAQCAMVVTNKVIVFSA